MDAKTARRKLQDITSDRFRYKGPDVQKHELIKALALAHSRIQDLAEVVTFLLSESEKKSGSAGRPFHKKVIF